MPRDMARRRGTVLADSRRGAEVKLDTNALPAGADADLGLLRILPKNRPWRLSLVALGEFLFGVRQSRAGLDSGDRGSPASMR
jgi:hypothetical protein